MNVFEAMSRNLDDLQRTLVLVLAETKLNDLQAERLRRAAATVQDLSRHLEVVRNKGRNPLSAVGTLWRTITGWFGSSTAS